MTANLTNLLPLIDQALAAIDQRGSSAKPEQAQKLRHALQAVRQQAEAGNLEPSRGVVTLGLTRGVADLGEPLDSPLIQALGAIESYYKEHCRE
jgi:type II secretory pathway component PulL